MAADSTLALSLVEEFVSGLQDSKAKDAAKGKRLSSRLAGDIFHKSNTGEAVELLSEDAQRDVMVN